MKAKEAATKRERAGRVVGQAPGHATTAAILGPASGIGPKQQLSDLPPAWAKPYRRLLELRARVEAERNGHALFARQPLEPYSMDMADAATDVFDHDLALCQLSAEQDALYEIDAALKRIENGTYGICELSGKPISQARLHALPWARFAEAVEGQLELEGATRPLHLGEVRSVTGVVTGSLGEAVAGEESPEPAPSDESLFGAPPLPGLELSVLEPLRRIEDPTLAKPVPPGRSKRKPGAVGRPHPAKGESYGSMRSLRKRIR